MNLLSLPSQIKINASALSLPEKLSFEEWKSVGEKLCLAENSVQWWIGDWLNYGEKNYGEKYKEAVEKTNKEYKTLYNYKYISSQIKPEDRNLNISWSGNALVAPLEPHQQKEWLDKAEKNDWSVSELRKAIQIEHRNVKTLEESVQGKFPVIYADPPWSYSNSGFKGSAAEHYPTMTTEDICAMNIPSTENAVLFLWVTNPLLEDAMQVVNAWGFEYKTNFVWVKDKATHLGFYCFGKHELLFIATKGSMLPKQEGMVNSVVEAVRTEHSKKPEMVYEMIEAMYDAPYLELFARQSRQGWSSFGNEL